MAFRSVDPGVRGIWGDQTTFKLLDYRQSSGRYEVMAFRSVDPGVRGIWGARGK
jgi:hypothetical protein